MVTLILAPVSEEFRLPGWPVELLYLMILAAAAVGLASSRRRRWAMVVVILTAVFRILGRSLDLEAASALATTLFVFVTAWAALTSLRFAFQSGHADRERMAAALSTYLLAGHMFGVCYWEVQHLRAGTFAMSGSPVVVGAMDLSTSVYFSFVTLATLGYGDIVPLTPTVRGLAVSEAIIGQLYLAVLVARLVGSRHQQIG
jgi:ion channel